MNMGKEGENCLIRSISAVGTRRQKQEPKE